MIFAGVIASFFFIGWRVATKGEYERRELAQCQALALSAAYAACGALDSPALAAYIKENGATKFIIDHMKMPGHNVVSVTIAPEGEGFFVTACAETGWNSRSPQKAEAAAVKNKDGISFAEKSAMADAFLCLAARGSDAETLTFTFPHERKCPVPFYVTAERTGGLYKTPLTVLRLAKMHENAARE